MPELPEVETVRIGLEKLLVVHTVLSESHDTTKGFPNSSNDVSRFLIGAKVVAVRRRAKVLMIDLDTDYTLVIHLKMTGQLVFVKNKQASSNKSQKPKGGVIPAKAGIQDKLDSRSKSRMTISETRFGAGHPNDSLIGKLPDGSTRVIFCLGPKKSSALGSNARKNRSAQQNVELLRSVSTGDSDAAGDQERWRRFGLRPEPGQCDALLFFNDQRKFGWVKLIPTVEVPNIDFMRKVGPEPLEDNFTPTVFIERIRRRANTTIKAALLDQTVLAGIGNIYADESLWGAKIHPATRVKDVPDAKLKVLFTEIQFVLRLSIEKGGSTDRNYVNAEGKKGSYIDFARVFRREGQPCPRHPGTEIIKTKVAGRGTHLCPKCQKLTLTT